jgi:lipoprotein-anchoring transpeptidase ErfK/SrfK
MRVSKIVLGGTAALAVALVSACGTGNAAPAAAPTGTTITTTTSAEPTTTTTTAPTTTTTTTTTTKKTTTTHRTPTTTRKTTTPTTTTRHKPVSTKVPGVPCSSYADACVDISADKAWLLSGGHVLYGPVSITSGRAGYRTPPGTFHVQWKDIDHKSHDFNDAPMPYSVFFNDGIAFHTGSLAAESHGCIHLSNSAAQKFFNNLQVGEVVQVVP